jgi:HEAT repeat protein/tRNA A37 threonylcarbamoyladenosine biosynthesis protein TsaE
MGEYTVFKILLGTKQGTTYPIKVMITPSGEMFSGSFTPPLTNAELTSFLNAMGIFLSKDQVHLISERRERLTWLGECLFEALFQEQVRLCYESALRAGQHLLVQISSQDPNLLALPWEFAYDPTYRQFLSLYDTTPIARQIELPSLIVPEPVERLRVLIAIASPSDLPALNVSQEKRNIYTAFDEAKEVLEVELLENACFDSLSARLAQQKYHVLHFVGHGGYSQKAKTGAIYLEDKAGQAEMISGETLGLLIRNTRSARLVVLNACESARNGWPGSFSTVAGALISADVPAVVAMQFPISDQAALAFSRAFYTALTQGDDLVRAVARGRRQIHHAISVTGSSLIHEWGTPVLYLGSDANPFVLVKPAVTRIPIAWNETIRQEIAYLRALIELGDLQEIRDNYVPLQATADRWVWESELEGVGSLIMRSGIDEQEELTLTQRQIGVQLLDEVAKYSQVVILGKPGSGKTTTLRYLARHYAELALQDNLRAKLPLLATLSEYDPEQDVIHFLRNQLADASGLSNEATYHLVENLESYLDDGRLVLLFDGLNELQDYRQAIAHLIRFIRKYPDNIFVFAGRDNDYRGELNIEHQLYIDQLDDQRIVDFVDKQAIEGINGSIFLQSLKDDGLLELARSPYLLSLMLRRAEYGLWTDFSHSRVELFDWAVQEMWRREGARPGRDEPWIEVHIENEALMRLAWEMNKTGKTTSERIRVDNVFRNTFADVGQPDVTVGVAVKQAVDAGLLIPSSSQQVRFQHQLLQDYFTARLLQRRFEEGASLNVFITDLSWHEAIVLLAGLLGANARDLIKTILTQPDDLFLNNLWLAARCLGEAQSALSRGGLRLIRIDLVDRLLAIFSQGMYTVLRRNAEAALVEIGDTRVITGLKQMMDDAQTDYLRVRATRALGRIGTTRVCDLLIGVLGDKTLPNMVRTHAAEALGRIGGLEAESALIQVFNDHSQDRQVRLRAVIAVGRLTNDTVREQLTNIARDTTEMNLLRERAVVALLSFSNESEVKDVLLGLVNNQDENRGIRGRAGDVLARFGGEEAREAFVRILNDWNEPVQVRARSALNLGTLGNPRDIPVLTAIAQDLTLERRLRWSATYALGYILRRAHDEPTVAMLGAMLQDDNEDHYVRWTAAYALGFSRSKRGLHELLHIIPKPHKVHDIERRAVEALGRYNDDEAIEALTRVVRDPDQYLLVRESALHGLARIGGEFALDVLISIARDRDSPLDMRRRALLALGTWGDVDEIDLLEGIVNDVCEPLALRDQAFTALERISRSRRLRLYPRTQKEEAMVEPMLIEMVGIPVLLRAVDFLFDEAKKIWDERRAARQSDESHVPAPPDIPLLAQDKGLVLKRKVSKEAVQRKERAIQGILKEIEVHEQNYQDARIGIARHGGRYDAPPILRHRLQEHEDAILEASQRLATLVESLSKHSAS